MFLLKRVSNTIAGRPSCWVSTAITVMVYSGSALFYCTFIASVSLQLLSALVQAAPFKMQYDPYFIVFSPLTINMQKNFNFQTEQGFITCQCCGKTSISTRRSDRLDRSKGRELQHQSAVVSIFLGLRFAANFQGISLVGLRTLSCQTVSFVVLTKKLGAGPQKS